MKSPPDSRIKIVAGFILAVIVGSMIFGDLRSFDIIPLRPHADWPLLDRLSALLRCGALGVIVVLVSVFLGTKHFTMFSRRDAILTRLPFGICGLALMLSASYTVLTKA